MRDTLWSSSPRACKFGVMPCEVGDWWISLSFSALAASGPLNGMLACFSATLQSLSLLFFFFFFFPSREALVVQVPLQTRNHGPLSDFVNRYQKGYSSTNGLHSTPRDR